MDTTDKGAGKCPVIHGSAKGHGNRDWWPHQLDLRILHQQQPASNPMGMDFQYAEQFRSLDLAALK